MTRGRPSNIPIVNQNTLRRSSRLAAKPQVEYNVDVKFREIFSSRQKGNKAKKEQKPQKKETAKKQEVVMQRVSIESFAVAVRGPIVEEEQSTDLHAYPDSPQLSGILTPASSVSSASIASGKQIQSRMRNGVRAVKTVHSKSTVGEDGGTVMDTPPVERNRRIVKHKANCLCCPPVVEQQTKKTSKKRNVQAKTALSRSTVEVKRRPARITVESGDEEGEREDDDDAFADLFANTEPDVALSQLLSAQDKWLTTGHLSISPRSLSITDPNTSAAIFELFGSPCRVLNGGIGETPNSRRGRKTTKEMNRRFLYPSVSPSRSRTPMHYLPSPSRNKKQREALDRNLSRYVKSARCKAAFASGLRGGTARSVMDTPRSRGTVLPRKKIQYPGVAPLPSDRQEDMPWNTVEDHDSDSEF